MRPALITLAITFLLLSQGLAQSGDFEIALIDNKANTLTGKANGQFRSFHVRPGAGVTINGLKATFQELELGMKIKIVSAEPGVATSIIATGLRTREGVGKERPAVGAGGAPAGQFKATIAANSPDAFPIQNVRKGSKILLQYSSGQWKSWGRMGDSNPDAKDIHETCRVAISLPSKTGQAGELISIIPAETAKRAFIFEAQNDYENLVLRINDKNNTYSENPGNVEYTVKIIPPN